MKPLPPTTRTVPLTGDGQLDTMFSPLRSNGDTEAGRPARGRIYRLDGSSGRSGVGGRGRGCRAAGPTRAWPPRRARRRKRTVKTAGVRGTGQALTHGSMDLDTHADTLDTPRPGSHGNPAQALTREQIDLDADADTLDTRHGRARAETPQGRSAAKSRSRRAEPRGAQPRRRHHTRVRTPCSPRPPAAGRRESCDHARGESAAAGGQPATFAATGGAAPLRWRTACSCSRLPGPL